MRLNTTILLAVVCAAALPARAEQADSPFDEIKITPVPVTWEYSNDGGKTFAKTPHEPPPAGQDPAHDKRIFAYVWKGTFEIADPAAVAGLWVRLVEDAKGPNGPRASICNGDLVAASGGFWKDLGFCPTLLDATILLNDKEVPIARGPMLQFWVPLIGELRKGTNTVQINGRVYTYWGGAAWAGTVAKSKAIDARIVSAAAQPAAIYNGPILGDFGDDYFTLACRTQMPAEVTVEATPLDPAATAVTVTGPRGVWHRLKVQLPKGARKVSYTLSARVGSHVTKRGPYSLALPGKDYRFAAFGAPMQQPRCDEPWEGNSKLVARAQPAFVVNTGNLMEQESWSFNWESSYTGPAAGLLASVPTLITPCNRDWTGIFNELHVTPAADGYNHNWTKVVGPVRFIGIEGNEAWTPATPNTKWLEGVLAEAKDKYIVVLSGYPAWSSGINSKRLNSSSRMIRDVVMPLLAKHKATLVLSSWDPAYERIEPTGDKGVTQIVTGCVGKGSWHKWDGRFGSHNLGPVGKDANARGTSGKVVLPDGREWCGYYSTRHICLFDVTDTALRLRVLACPGKAADADIKDLQVLDERVFQPRN